MNEFPIIIIKNTVGDNFVAIANALWFYYCFDEFNKCLLLL
jgi:hypothetical protein